jgi:hypothetical protein
MAWLDQAISGRTIADFSGTGLAMQNAQHVVEAN